jgi:DNA-binding transcriptional MerR regulator
MPTIENQTLSKLYYSIGEVAELLQVNASLLRFWEKEFNLSVSKKNKKGNRLYTAKEIEKIQRIYHFVKIEGYTLEGAKKALKAKVEPNLVLPNEIIDTPLEIDTTHTNAASALDTETLISKLEDIKKRLLSLHFEEISNTKIASTTLSTPSTLEQFTSPVLHLEKSATIALEKQNETQQTATSSNAKSSKPKSAAKPKPSTDTPTLFDF